MVAYLAPQIVPGIVVGLPDAWVGIIPNDSRMGNPRRDNSVPPRLLPWRIHPRRLLAFDQCRQICDNWHDHEFCALPQDYYVDDISVAID